MKRLTSAFILVFLLAAVTVRCTPGPSPSTALATLTATAIQLPPTPTPTLALPTATAVPPTPTPVPQGRTLLVTSAADSGPGTPRQAMQDAQSHDTITFDP